MTRTDANEASHLVTLTRLGIILRGRGGRNVPDIWIRATRDRFSGLILSFEILVGGKANPKRVWRRPNKGGG